MPQLRRALALVALIVLSTLARPGGSQPTGAGAAPLPAATRSAAEPPPPAAASAPRAALPPIDAAEPQRRAETLAADVRRWGGRVGVIAIDVASGATLVALDEHGLYNPASNAKLLTAATALRLLGPSHRYVTGLYGVRSGNEVAELVLRGAGDPSLATRDLWEMARDLRAAGIRKVGSVAVDQGYFDDLYVPPAFEQQPHEWAAFRAPVAAVSLNENTVLFTIRATRAGEPASVVVDPPGLIDLAGSVATAEKGTPEKIVIELEPRGARLAVRLGGNVPEGSRLVRLARRVEDPRLLAGYALKEILEGIGVQVAGEPRLGGGRQKRLLVVHRSAPLGQLLDALGKDSDNFYAETIFKTIAAEQRGRPGTSATAAELVAETLDDLGAAKPGVIVKNGSGLFDANRASPWSMAVLLRAASRDPALNTDFTAQLAIGGVDGTLRGRFSAWAKQRAIRAKTGTLDAVASLSGYVLPPAGRSPIAFSILVNDIPGKVGAAREGMDRVVDALARELWKGAR